MTINERLSEAGLAEDFEAAIRARDRERVISILTRVELSPEDAAFTADTIFGSPKRHGY